MFYFLNLCFLRTNEAFKTDNSVWVVTKDKDAELDKSCETSKAHLSNFWVMQQTLTSRGCVNQFKSFSKHRSFSCFVCVHVFMSLMWFFYPRASSGSLSQESKCGTPATASPHVPFVYVRACMYMYVRTQNKQNPLPPQGFAHLYMHDFAVHDTHCTCL